MWKLPLMLIFITSLLSPFNIYGCPTCVARSDEQNTPFFEDESVDAEEQTDLVFTGSPKESL